MNVQYFSQDGVLREQSAATISLFDINYAYGYGVYETLKLRRGVLYFADQHCERLQHSARVVGITLPWSATELEAQIRQLVAANALPDANIKVMCIGDSRARKTAEVHLYILMLNPLFPPRHLYSRGATVIGAAGERHFPTAKTLDMLLSAVLYRRARHAGAYDALLIDAAGYVNEGTRTNLFVTDGSALYTPPHDRTLFGVTKQTVISCARAHDIRVEERLLPWDRLQEWSGLFLTSTSSKIVPVCRVDERAFSIPPLIRELIAHYNRYLADYAAGQPPGVAIAG